MRQGGTYAQSHAEVHCLNEATLGRAGTRKVWRKRVTARPEAVAMQRKSESMLEDVAAPLTTIQVQVHQTSIHPDLLAAALQARAMAVLASRSC